MPYIPREDRPKYEDPLTTLIATLREQPTDRIDGELNYIITRILKETYPPRYHTINRAIGVLEACKLEYYRRVAAPYEDTKIEQNGDV